MITTIHFTFNVLFILYVSKEWRERERIIIIVYEEKEIIKKIKSWYFNEIVYIINNLILIILTE